MHIFENLETRFMALESSDIVLYIVHTYKKISYKSGNWFGNCLEGTKILLRHTETHTDTNRHTHTHTHINAYFVNLVFLRKSRNKTKK